MFPGGFCGNPGVLDWVLMIGFWAGLLAVAVWTVARLFPTSGNRHDPVAVPEQPAPPEEPSWARRHARYSSNEPGDAEPNVIVGRR